MHISRCKYDYECITEVNRLETKVSNNDAEFMDVVMPEKVTLTFIHNPCSKELHIAQVVGNLMAINEDSDVKAEGVVDNLMPDVVMKERFDDAEDYKVDGDPYLYFSPDRIRLDENGILYENDVAEDDFSSVSFDLGGTFVTDADVEVPEALKPF
ncbi:hypothetical protein Tco_0424678 [Tanacetum coccineum]